MTGVQTCALPISRDDLLELRDGVELEPLHDAETVSQRRGQEACARGGASLHVNGIDPGFANDVLPLVMTSLSRRIDEVRVMEICDYSTYYQPVVMNDIFGFGKPMDEVGMIFQPGILTMAWGSVVRQIAAGLDVTLDEQIGRAHV